MEEIRTRARLVDPAASSLFTRGLTTLVPRSEVEEAFRRGEFPAALVLDVARSADDDVSAHAQVTVDWDKAMLEELLSTTEDDQIRLSFDADELEQALQEAEVDAHGLRERAAVLVIGVAAAGATAGGAFAAQPSVAESDAAPGATVTATAPATTGADANPLARYVASIDSRATAETPSFVSDVAAGGTGSPAGTVAPISDVASGGSGQAAPDALARYVANVSDDVAATPAPSFVSDVASGGTGDATTDALSRYVANVGSDVGSTPTVAAPAAADSGSSISLPSPGEGAAIAGGLALLIMGAGFTAVRARRPPEQPA